ncbi:dimethylsulfonioproprionate lyase DddP [Salaquimonas pukyongi]|uniref:dimethylsulfonioproprionate lyase DddP n=1 Tax=Salaquimonas pukyongi TaxID=2712698 RepID=UPI00096BA8E2|nr:dimethylsulfonioproprionate lyase DddP [Salaquimonas pukyongi]
MDAPEAVSGYQISNRKIDPSRRMPVKPDGSPDDNDRVEIGPTALAFEEWAAAGLEPPNLAAMRRFRLDRLVAEINKRDYAGLLMMDPLNIRYATDSTNMQLWNAHNPFRACLVLADGYMVLWDYKNSPFLADFNPLVREVRGGASMFYFGTGDKTDSAADSFTGEIQSLMRDHAGENRRLAVDKIMVAGLKALEQRGIEVMEGEEVTEKARVIKGEEEIKAMRCSVHACEQAVAAMERAAAPGMTEDDVWAVLHAENIKRGGEWIETRLLASGPRTYPWFQECGPRVIQNNEILAFDTDLIGTYGLCVDISRTWFLGDGEPTDLMKKYYQIGYQHIMENMALLKPGVRFDDLVFKGHQLPDYLVEGQYGCRMHGVGLCDEWPLIAYPQNHVPGAFDYELEAGMMLCVEALIGSEDAGFSIKLEDQVLVTEDGFENLTSYPYDRKFLS